MDFETQIRDAYKQQKHSKCIQLIDQAPENIKSSSQYKILKASCLNNIFGKSKSAHLILDDVISEEPANSFAHYGKGLVFINEGNLIEAVKCFDKAIEIDPSGRMDKARQMKTRAQNMIKPTKKISTEASKSRFKTKTEKKREPKHSEPVYCPVCKKEFAKVFSLTRHMLLHTGIRPHKCEFCGFGFIQKSDLNRHLATHSTVANFCCHICNKRFKTKKNLHCHLVTHSDTRPFKCFDCGKSFRANRLLLFHMRCHKEDSKPFRCDICGKRFLKKKYVQNHIKLHDEKTKQEASSIAPFKIFDVKSEPIEYKCEVKMEPEVILNDDSLEDFVDALNNGTGTVFADDEMTFGDIVCKQEEQSDWNFCISLLNDISKMNDDQKKEFRTRTLETVDEILGH